MKNCDMQNSETRINVRCSSEELKIIDMRAANQKLSRSRYLIEAGLNSRGITDWQERSRRECGIFELVTTINKLEHWMEQNNVGDEQVIEPVALAAKIGEVNVAVDRLLHFYKTGELVPEQEAILFNKFHNSQVARACVDDYYTNDHSRE